MGSTSTDSKMGPAQGHNPGAVEPQSTPASYDLEKLGRQRPEVFVSPLSECSFCFSLLASILMAVCLFRLLSIVILGTSFSYDVP